MNGKELDSNMSEIDYVQFRKDLFESIDEIISKEDDIVLSGMIIIYEGIHPDGTRSFNMVSSNATGDDPMVPWIGEGMLAFASKNYDTLEFFEHTEDGDEIDE